MDFSSYAPAYEDQAAFVASAIDNEGERVGVLVFQMPVEKLNGIMTGDGNWQEVGLGRSGETYLVGRDFKARSVSRALIEQPDVYAETLEANGVAPEIVSFIRVKQNSTGLQLIHPRGTEAAARGETGLGIFPGYLGKSVLSAYAPLGIQGLDWMILSEIEVGEAFQAARFLSEQLERLVGEFGFDYTGFRCRQPGFLVGTKT